MNVTMWNVVFLTIGCFEEQSYCSVLV